jgi:sugar fermentation stimulation protein A
MNESGRDKYGRETCRCSDQSHDRRRRAVCLFVSFFLSFSLIVCLFVSLIVSVHVYVYWMIFRVLCRYAEISSGSASPVLPLVARSVDFRSTAMAVCANAQKRRRVHSSTGVSVRSLDNLYDTDEDGVALHPGTLHRRYKRFLGDVALGPDTGEQGGHRSQGSAAELTTVHVPNTGPMTGLLENVPVQVLLSKSANPKRKYAYTLEWMNVDGTWVGVHSAKANSMVGQLLDMRTIDEYLPPYTMYNREVKLGGSQGKTRIDFELVDEGTGARCLIEVKSVTMKSDGMAVFPDTKSERAQKHIQELIHWKRGPGAQGSRGTMEDGGGKPEHGGGKRECMMIYVVQRDDCESFLPCKEKDPVYYDLVRAAYEQGEVKVLVIEVGLDARGDEGEFRVVYRRVMDLGQF